MKLYYSPGACSLAAHIVVREAGLDAELVKVDLKTKQTEKGEDFKAVNPKGYVPAIVLDDGDLLTENIAVLPYLATLGSNLFPKADGSKTFYHALETLGFVSTELHKSFGPVFKPGPDEVKKAAREHVANRLKLAATKLGSNDFMLGSSFSIVDAYLFVMLRWSKKNEVEVPSELASYFDRLQSRPSVKKALEEEGLTA